MIANKHIYEKMLTDLNDILTTYIGDVVTNVITAITPIVTMLILIYVLLLGWALMSGMISEPVTDSIKRIVLHSLFIWVALIVGRYNGIMSETIWNIPDDITRYIALGYDETQNIQYLDGMSKKIYNIGSEFMQKANDEQSFFYKSGLIFVSVLAWSSGLAITLYPVCIILVSKIALVILFGAGPIFIIFNIYEPTKRLFEAWIGLIVNYAQLAIMISLAIKFVIFATL